MLKKAYFLEKTVKFASASRSSSSEPILPPMAGGSALRPPRWYSRLLWQLCPVRF